MASRDFLVVSETFYSIQGEGASAGVPAVFLRLAGCNLRCDGFTYRDSATDEHLGCDSKHVWRFGQKMEFTEILSYWQTQGWLGKLMQGAHLVITGGEPVIQQRALSSFIEHLDKSIFIEIETNATLLINAMLLDRINQFNVSPKLAHSGEPTSKAYQPHVLQALLSTHKTVLKFVVASPQDIDEIMINYIEPFQFPRSRVWLMPEGGSMTAITAKKPWVVELCKQHLFNFTSRLQIDIWDEVTGV
ncbi:MAG: hypothetical protein A3F17_08200 [Gammaproteobacteria bacterium RIFCSPHIGHO2_12_FULL_41_15]|nr:MAG: hypothetical protein A3F17_08200 [Gammaproteobacteria bacterium RIFCSPHIGHO2_12_FULL_41_15]